MIPRPEEREAYVRSHAPELLGMADPLLCRAHVAAVSLRHRENLSDVILTVRRRESPADDRPFQLGFILDFTATEAGEPPRPAAFYRREGRGQSWRPFLPAPEPVPAVETKDGDAPLPPAPAFLFSPTAGRLLAALLICIGLWASFSPLRDTVLGIRSHFWKLAKLTATADGWSFVNPADGREVTLAERRFTVARQGRSEEAYALAFRGIGHWLLVREEPLFVRVNPAEPTRSVLIRGIPPESAGLLLLFLSPVFAGIRLLIDIRAAGATSLKDYYFSRPPPFAIIPLVHLGIFALYLATAVCWQQLILVPMPGLPALVLLAVMGCVELRPGLWSWLYSFPKVRRLLLHLLLLALLPLGVALVGLGLPFALALVTGFLLLVTAVSVFLPAYLPQNLIRLLWVPVYLAGSCAALRALALLAYILMPVVRVPYHQPAHLLGDITAVARFDVCVGVAGVVVVLGSTILDTFWRLRQVRQLENLPTSRAASAARGIAEFAGVARNLPGTSGPILQFQGADLPVVRRFYLEDASGRILVDPTGAVFRTGRATSLSGRLNEIVLTRRLVPAQIDRPISMELRAGDPVYLIGNVMTGDDGERVVQPLVEPGVTDPFARLLLGKTSLPPARDIQHVFFLSDTGEALARRHIVAGIKEIWAMALVCLLLSFFLISYQLPRASGGTTRWSLSEVLEAKLDPDMRIELATAYLLGEGEIYRHSRSHWLRDLPYAGGLLHVKDLREGVDLENYLWNKVNDPSYRNAAPHLARLARHAPDPGIRRYAVWALGKIGAPPEIALPVLYAALNDPDAEMRATAAYALARVAPAAREDTIAALLAATADREAAVSRAALFALRSVPGLAAGNGLLERIVPLLGHADKYVRHEAANVLARLGRGALPALDELRRATADAESIVRNSAIVALGEIGPEAATALPELLAALQETESAARQFAATALGAIGPAAREALPALQIATGDNNQWVRAEATQAIRKIGGH